MQQPSPGAQTQHSQLCLSQPLNAHVGCPTTLLFLGNPKPRGTNPDLPGLGAEEKCSKGGRRRKNSFRSSPSPAQGLELQLPPDPGGFPGPACPGLTCSPGSPHGPGLPSKPGRPSEPGCPTRPGKPWGPGSPWGEKSKHRKLKNPHYGSSKGNSELCLPLPLELGKSSVHPGAASVGSVRDLQQNPGIAGARGSKAGRNTRAGRKQCSERRSSESSCISSWLRAVPDPLPHAGIRADPSQDPSPAQASGQLFLYP